MQKIKLIADTACDIPDSDLEQWGIELMSVPIAIEGKGYDERKSFSMEEFYTVLAGTDEIPATSRVPADRFLDCYRRALEEGCTHLICVTINAGGSGTNASAQMAREHFYASVAGAREALEIHIVDSRSYSMGFGWPTVQAAKMARAGKDVQEILAYLGDYINSVEIYLGVYTLEFAKRSGRIGAAAAFVGEVLGLRPIIAMIDGTTKTVEKVRGEKKVAQYLLDAYLANRRSPDDPVLIVCGQDQEYGVELQEMIRRETGKEAPIYTAGASIVINAGPRMLAIVCNGNNRPAPQKSE